MGIVSLLMGNKTLIVGLILVAIMSAMYVQIIVLHNKNKALKAEKATISVMLTESQANLTQLSNDIKRQNAAVDRMKAEADVLAEKNAVLLAEAEKNAGKYKTRSTAILARVVPPNTTKCDAANELFNEEIRARVK